MNIVSINSFDAIGGAAKVAYDLHGALRDAGHNSKMLVGTKYGDDPDVIALHPGDEEHPRTVGDWMRKAVRKGEKVTGLQYVFSTPAGRLLRMDLMRRADIVHLHNVHGGYLNLWSVKSLSEKKPVLWTLHDMWPITGHCAHSFDCNRWKRECGNCPYLNVEPSMNIDTTRLLWKIKSRSYKKAKMTLTVPSRWLLDKLPESLLAHAPVHLISNAVDTRIYHPMEKNKSREVLDLPRDKFIVTFTAHAASQNPWKGFNYLIEALSVLKSAFKYQPYLVMIGNKNHFSFETVGLEGRSVGLIREAGSIAGYLAASDAFLAPSIAENSPLVVLEALACGTPVVGFDVGGVPELVRHKEQGFLAAYKDPRDFANGIKWLIELGKEEFESMRCRCIGGILEKHTLVQQVRKFLTLYESMAGC